MLFDIVPEFAHLKRNDHSGGPAAVLMNTILDDYDTYERRIESMRNSLIEEFTKVIHEANTSLQTTKETYRLEESRAEEEAIRQRAHATTSSNRNPTEVVRSTQDGYDQSDVLAPQSKLVEFWRMKFGELQREVEMATIKRDAMNAKLDDIASNQNSTTAKTTKAIAALNEKIVTHKRLAQYFMNSLHAVVDSQSNEKEVDHSSHVEASPWVKALEKAEGEGLQQVLEAATLENEALHKLASFLTKRESVLKYKVQKIQQKVSVSSGDNTLEDVLFLRAEVRGLKEQLDLHRRIAPIGDSNDIRKQVMEELSAQHNGIIKTLTCNLEDLQKKMREVRVSIIRAEHKSRDGSMIVKRAVDEQRLRALRERLGFVEKEKLHELERSHQVSLSAHYDATLLAGALK